jgi:hypothetical protein
MMVGSDRRSDPAVHLVSDLRSDTTFKLRYGLWKTLIGVLVSMSGRRLQELGQTEGQTRDYVVGRSRGLSSGLTPLPNVTL